jgi:hypothetical protein
LAGNRNRRAARKCGHCQVTAVCDSAIGSDQERTILSTPGRYHGQILVIDHYLGKDKQSSPGTDERFGSENTPFFQLPVWPEYPSSVITPKNTIVPVALRCSTSSTSLFPYFHPTRFPNNAVVLMPNQVLISSATERLLQCEKRYPNAQHRHILSAWYYLWLMFVSRLAINCLPFTALLALLRRVLRRIMLAAETRCFARLWGPLNFHSTG